MSRRSKDKPCECALCAPKPGQRPHPKYGYDMNEVPKVECLRCEEPIGHEEYVEVAMLARFGQMSFLHARCAK